jgi:hypothetical protein
LEKKKKKLAFKFKQSKKTADEDAEKESRVQVYEEGKGYIKVNEIKVEKLPQP